MQIDQNFIGGVGPSTQITTYEYGLTEAINLVGKSLSLADENCRWVKGEAVLIKDQQVYELSLRAKGGNRIKIIASENQLWPIRKPGQPQPFNHMCKKTWELCRNDYFCSVEPPIRPIIDTKSKEYQNGLIHGICFSFGLCIRKRKKDPTRGVKYKIDGDNLEINFFGKQRDIVQYIFNKLSVVHRRYSKIITVPYNGQKFRELPKTDDCNYLTGFIRGLMGVDGFVRKQIPYVDGMDDTKINWLMEYGPRVGFHPRRCTLMSYYIRGQKTVMFERRSLVREDWLIDWEYLRMPKTAEQRHFGLGRIDSITKLKEKTDVVGFKTDSLGYTLFRHVYACSMKD